ncbi:hypothetical protein GDO86_009640 [Hymenochirus boettgeri]|uniref:A-kinase anchor protein 7-like phosphoesterase domain-containing protein n=1 Tax=Hymenochirus boettgeri TaxID=247094 RepID=A0A8T2JJS2_9PIPI|nr:hypothetical protein GDO86_009640 [Hymenochirus boettgeri]
MWKCVWGLVRACLLTTYRFTATGIRHDSRSCYPLITHVPCPPRAAVYMETALVPSFVPAQGEEETDGLECLPGGGATENLEMEMTEETSQKNRIQSYKQQINDKSKDSTENLLKELPLANDDICAVFEIAKTVEKKVKKKTKRKLLEETEDGATVKKQKRANYFVSLPILNPKILCDIQTFQDTVLQKDQRLARAMIPKGTFHLTLFVMHLATEEDINLATSALLDSKGPVEEVLQGKTLVLSFHGVAEFKNEVIFGKMTEDDSQVTLKEISETIEKIFNRKGITSFGNKGFIPHLTFMKLSRSPKLRKQGLKKIDASLYKEFQDHNFGQEFLVRLDLCSMLKKRQENGYYHTEASIHFGSCNTEDFLVENNKLPESSESSKMNDKEVKMYNAYRKAPFLQKGSQIKNQSYNISDTSDTCLEEKDKTKSKLPIQTLSGQVEEIGHVNTQLINSAHELNKASISQLISLQKQRMEAEQDQWKQNQKNMQVLDNRLAAIEEQQIYTNRNLKGLNKKLSFIGKQLSRLVQVLQPSVGISTASESHLSNSLQTVKENEEQLDKVDHLKENLT